MSKHIHLSGLNGFRAIAALMVVIGHISNEYSDSYTMAGHFVTMFFVLSGFLITFLLLKEKEIAPIDIKKFYVRRILRIWPLYFLFFAVCIAVIYFNNIPADFSYTSFYFLLSANVPYVLGASLPFLAHYWSLGTEEQFYLFFPSLARTSNLLLISICLAITLFLLKIGCWYLERTYDYSLPYAIANYFRFHIMLIGVIGAILFYKKQVPKFVYHKITQIICWLLLGSVILNKFHFISLIDTEIMAFTTLILILGQVTHKGIINLENRPMNFVGKISYGIYVIHPLVIYFFVSENQILSYSLILFFTLAFAKISYELYEKRFLKMKWKYAVVKSG